MAASCLHHLQNRAKHRALSLSHRLAPEFYMEELEANHDRPDRDSPELIWSVQRFYSSLLKSVDNSRLSKQQKNRCNNDFLLAEAVGILTKPKSLRGNHHTLMSEWSELALSAGFQVARIQATTLNRDGLRSLAFHLTASSAATPSSSTDRRPC